MKPLIGEILVERFGVDPAEVEKALAWQAGQGGRLGELLVHAGAVDGVGLARALAWQLSLPWYETVFPPGTEAEPLLPEGTDPAWWLGLGVVPTRQPGAEQGGALVLEDPHGEGVGEMRRVLGLASWPVVVADARRFRELEEAFREKFLPEEENRSYTDQELETLRDQASEAPVVRLVNDLVSRAVSDRASDIHIEQGRGETQVRFRIDGVLHRVDAVPPERVPAVLSRLKLLAQLDIAEKRLPQDGRIQTRMGGRTVDIRLSTLPTLHGENVVMRLLQTEKVVYRLADLGMEEEDRLRVEGLMGLTHGIVLLTGPTGSGKTTTLYALLQGVDHRQRKVITVEDPVEYQMEGVSQVQVNETAGLGFATVLRHMLRQDPDVMMIGEIRDRETAEMAVQAALTGHLVLATLHTNDALSAVTRLEDMGIPPYLVHATLSGVVAQRLVRRVCSECGASTGDSASPRRGTGCPACARTGYRGRLALYEVVVMRQELRRALLGGDEEGLKRALVHQGWHSLRDDGLEKALRGWTTSEEVYRVVGRDAF